MCCKQFIFPSDIFEAMVLRRFNPGENIITQGTFAIVIPTVLIKCYNLIIYANIAKIIASNRLTDSCNAGCSIFIFNLNDSAADE